MARGADRLNLRLMIAPLIALLTVQAPVPDWEALNGPDALGRSVYASSRRRGGSLSRYFSTEDYPAAAMRYEQQGAVGFRLALAPDGRISDCVVTRSSGSAVLDRSTCRILSRRVRYAPNPRMTGRTTPISDRGTVRWTLAADRQRQRYPDLVPPPHGWTIELPPECKVPYAPDAC